MDSGKHGQTYAFLPLQDIKNIVPKIDAAHGKFLCDHFEVEEETFITGKPMIQ